MLADGRIVRADASQNPDLFWALRGAGANFGIVTSLELDAYPVGNVGALSCSWTPATPPGCSNAGEPVSRPRRANSTSLPVRPPAAAARGRAGLTV